MRAIGQINGRGKTDYKAQPLINIEQTVNAKTKSKNRKKNKVQNYSRKQNR